MYCDVFYVFEAYLSPFLVQEFILLVNSNTGNNICTINMKESFLDC